MIKKPTSIEFSHSRLRSSTSRHEPDDESYDFEEWELDYELREKKDWPGLVEYCKQRVERLPDDPYAQYYLGEAYVLNGEYDKTLEFLSEHHRKQPDNTDYQHVILDALYALGKTEDHFDWVQKPVILRMSTEILDACYALLRTRRKPRSLNETHLEFVIQGYVLFTEEELLKALLEDGRFEVENSDAVHRAEVRVARKTRTRRK